MEAHQVQLLEAVKGALTGQPCPVCLDGPEDWQALWQLAEEQKVVPLAVEALAPALRQRDPEMLRTLRGTVLQTVSLQVRKSRAFQTAYRRLEEAQVHPLVVKGLMCRELYPKPDLRVSADEDLLLPPEEMPTALRVLEQCGLAVGKADEEQVVSCFSRETGLYLELHRTLFSASSAAYGSWNRQFDRCAQRAVRQRVEGMEYATLCHQDHLLYLILHSLKHFLHSGFGVRQVCDICLFAAAHGEALDWPALTAALRETRADLFTANLLDIGWKELGIGPYPPPAAAWLEAVGEDLDPLPLLEDLLSGGIYGGNTDQRKHSSLITLHAVEEGAASHPSSRLLHTVFPSAKELQGAYPYLRQKPWLLPAAWVQRIVRYTAENRGQHGAPQESVEIGERRVALLKKYRVIE